MLFTLPKVKRRRLANLANSQDRLKAITSELLETANDLDQHLKYAGKPPTSPEFQKLKTVLDDLGILTETLPVIDQLIDDRKVEDINNMLSASSRLADKVNRMLLDIKRTSKVSLIKDGTSVIDVEVVDG